MSCALDILVLKSQTKDHPRLDTDLNKAITTKEIKQTLLSKKLGKMWLLVR